MAHTQQLQVTAAYEGGGSSDVTGDADTSYSSSAPTIASVSTGGLVTGLAEGTATITASYKGKTDTCAVTVNRVLESIDATPNPVAVAASATQPLTVTATYDVGATADVTASSTYDSSDDAVATVAADGTVTGVAAGTATVTVTYQGKTDAVTVNVT